jgi:hypothetical protein
LPQTHSIEQSPKEIPINLFNQTITTRNPHKPIQSNNHLKKSQKKENNQSNNPQKKSPQTHSIKQSPEEIPTKENNQSNNHLKKSP